MKNILKLLLCLIIVSSSMTVFSQNDPLETETAVMNCFYNNLPDQGKEFKSALQKAEQKLIDKNYLKDTTGESYVTLYKNLENLVDNELGQLGMIHQFMSIQRNMNLEENTKCMERILSSSEFETSKLNQFLQYSETLVGANVDYLAVANKIFTILDAKDFEHDYYRMTTLIMIETMNMVDTHHLELPSHEEETYTKEELDSAIKIEINEKGQLFVYGKKIPLTELRKKVINYLKEYKSKNVILLGYSLKTNYKDFISVQNEVIAGYNAVRNELAQEKYNRSFDELKEDERKKIKDIYPLRIKESETNE